jgi:hypothetical protein
MVTNAEQADPGLPIEEQAEMFARSVIAGHPQGSVRRILLYIVAGTCAVGALLFAPLIVPAIAAGVLLLATDQLL